MLVLVLVVSDSTECQRCWLKYILVNTTSYNSPSPVVGGLGAGRGVGGLVGIYLVSEMLVIT